MHIIKQNSHKTMETENKFHILTAIKEEPNNDKKIKFHQDNITRSLDVARHEANNSSSALMKQISIKQEKDDDLEYLSTTDVNKSGDTHAIKSQQHNGMFGSEGNINNAGVQVKKEPNRPTTENPYQGNLHLQQCGRLTLGGGNQTTYTDSTKMLANPDYSEIYAKQNPQDEETFIVADSCCSHQETNSEQKTNKKIEQLDTSVCLVLDMRESFMENIGHHGDIQNQNNANSACATILYSNEKRLYNDNISSSLGNIQQNTAQEQHMSTVCNMDYTTRNRPQPYHTAITGERPFQCNLCWKRFSEYANLKQHMRTHTGEKPYECNVCKKRFSHSGSLTRHMRIHTGEKPYGCNVCEKRFTDSSNLSKHLATHTAEKFFQCEVCEKKFARSHALVVHMRTHTEAKPYECKVCAKRFFEAGKLTRHMRIHTGEKPYECNICKKRFNVSGNCAMHMRLHTGEKNFVCDVCGKGFTRLSHLNTHMKIHTGLVMRLQKWRFNCDMNGSDKLEKLTEESMSAS